MSLRASVAAVAVGFLVCAVAGCATFDRAYNKQVTWEKQPVAQVVTNTVVATNTVFQVVERTNVVLVTNVESGAVSGYATREPVATNLVTMVVTNIIPVWYTNLVSVPVTNLVAKPEAEAAITAAGSVANTFFPGIGSILALALGGLYHGYSQVRNRKVNEALIQGVETARAVLETTPQGQAADAQFVKWLMDHQKEAGVFTTVSALVDQLTDNPAAKLTAQEIVERLQRAEQARPLSATAPVAPAPAPVPTPGCPSGNCVATMPVAAAVGS
jgi:hypothetical protein